MSQSVTLLGVVGLACLAYHLIQQWRHNKRLPPQPPALPLVGNLLQYVPAAKNLSLHMLLNKWARQYGEIFRVKLGPVTIYYLNSDAAVKVRRLQVEILSRWWQQLTLDTGAHG